MCFNVTLEHLFRIHTIDFYNHSRASDGNIVIIKCYLRWIFITKWITRQKLLFYVRLNFKQTKSSQELPRDKTDWSIRSRTSSKNDGQRRDWFRSVGKDAGSARIRGKQNSNCVLGIEQNVVLLKIKLSWGTIPHLLFNRTSNNLVLGR